jgi:hypothetical protein
MLTVGDNVRYYGVDHSPSYLWDSATWEISEALLPHLRPLLAGPQAWSANETIRRSIEIRAGVIQNPRILSFQHRSPDYPHPPHLSVIRPRSPLPGVLTSNNRAPSPRASSAGGTMVLRWWMRVTGDLIMIQERQGALNIRPNRAGYAGASRAARPDGAQSLPVLFTPPVQIYKAVREQLRDPHRPRPAASGESRAVVTAQRPGIASVASFDTAFHITIPAASATYAILLE